MHSAVYVTSYNENHKVRGSEDIEAERSIKMYRIPL